MPDVQVLTPEEASAYLRINYQTTYRLLRAGTLPGIKCGHQWRILRTDLEAYLRGGGAKRAIAE